MIRWLVNDNDEQSSKVNDSTRHRSECHTCYCHAKLSQATSSNRTHHFSIPMSLDALKAEIAVKRKATPDDSARPSKYMRRGELEKLKAEQEAKEREEKEKARQQRKEQEEREAAETKAREKVSSLIFVQSNAIVLRRLWRTGCSLRFRIAHA